MAIRGSVADTTRRSYLPQRKSIYSLCTYKLNTCFNQSISQVFVMISLSLLCHAKSSNLYTVYIVLRYLYTVKFVVAFIS